MTQTEVGYESSDGVAIISLNRPERRNALNPAVVNGLHDAWLRFETGEDRAALLKANGGHFSVGADMDDVPELARAVPGIGVEVTKPVVTATEGWCVGGGFILIQMSDLCVAADTTRFLYPEAKIGLTGGAIASLAARVPHKVAMEFMLLGEPLSAQRAYEVGMVNRVVPAGTQDDEAMKMARALAAMAPLVTTTLKTFVGDLLPAGPVEQAGKTAVALARIKNSSDFAEGVAAFKDKRAPSFKGC